MNQAPSERPPARSDLQPESGVRVRLDFVAQSSAGARYELTLFFVDGVVRGAARIPESGPPELSLESDVPAYALQASRAFARQAQGSFTAMRRWPRRVLRWRAEK